MIGWAVIAVVVVLQALPFTEGYRRSADEVAFLDVSTQGLPVLAKLTEALAVSQGRLGLLFTVPLNAAGSYFSDILAARTTFVLLHFGVLALFAFYFSLISASRVTAALLLLLVSLQPLSRINEFMPPVAYPLQNSLPFLGLLLARWIIIEESRREEGCRPNRLWPAYIVFTLAMITTEYAFLLGTSMLFAEYGFALGRQVRQGSAFGDWLAGMTRQRVVWFDALSVVLALIAYFGFRLIYPSTYEGNVVNGALEIQRVLATTFRHVWAGTIFSHHLGPPLSAPWYAWTAAAVVCVGTIFGLVLSLPGIKSMPTPLAIVAGCVVVIVYVSFPIAANLRQQRWCLDEGSCGYLDSRLSYLAAAVAILSGLAWMLRSLAWPPLARAFVVSVSVVSGIVAGLAFMDNWQRGRTMYAEAGAWRNADLLACYPDYQPKSDALLLKMIDGDRWVPFHPGADPAGFWRRYLRYASRFADCASTGAASASRLAAVERLGPVIAMGQTINFAASKAAAAYLGPGWSQPEPPFGIWSDGPQAELMFVPRGLAAGRQAYLKVNFIPYFGPSVVKQTIEVLVDGLQKEQWILTMEQDRAGCCERFIPLPRGAGPDGLVTVVFRLAHPRTPSLEPGSPETRRLGMALVAAALTDSRSSSVQ